MTSNQIKPVTDNICSGKTTNLDSIEPENNDNMNKDHYDINNKNVNRDGTITFLKHKIMAFNKDKISFKSIAKNDIWPEHKNEKTTNYLKIADDAINEIITKSSDDEKNKLNIDGLNQHNYNRNKKIILLPIILILIAEILLYKSYFNQSLIIHTLNLLGLSFSTAIIQNKALSNTFQAFSLLPLLRILNMAMPVFFQLTLYWYIFMYGCIFMSIIYIIKHQKFTREQIGLTFKKLNIYIPIAVVLGAVFGIMEFQTIQNPALIENMDFKNILLLSIVMILFVGLAEELIFRSIIQTRLEQTFDTKWSLIISSFLFGIMHSGYGTIYEIIFTSLAGIVLGYMFIRSRSLPLIATTHGFINIFLFGVIPFYDLLLFK